MSAEAIPLEQVSNGDFLRALAASGQLTILDLLDNVPWFRGSVSSPAAPWVAWRAFLASCYGLPMTDEEVSIYQRCTGRREPPTEKAREAWLIVGRRGRKSAIAAAIGVWEGVFRDHSGALAPGERAMIPIIAKNKADAGTIKAFIGSILDCKNLREFLAKPITGDEVSLTTRVDMVVRAVSLTAGRSRVVPAALLDETAFWKSDMSAQPDTEVIAGIRPAMATVDGGLLVGLSSPYDKRGVLWEAYSEHYGQEGPILVWKADTLTMHDSPRIRAYVRIQYEGDPVSADAEYGANFRTDIGPFVQPEVVDAAVMAGVEHIPFDPARPKACFAFCDPSGGSQDSFALAVSDHHEGKLRLVYAREWPAPFSPDDVCDDVAQALKSYRVTYVTGDHVGGVWLRDPLLKRGISYIVTKHSKSEIYRDILPRLNARNILLLDQLPLIRQIKRLERKVHRGGDVIDHPPGDKDDLANACLGALSLADAIKYRDPAPEEPYMPTTAAVLKHAIQQNMATKGRPTMRPAASPGGRLAAYRRRRQT